MVQFFIGGELVKTYLLQQMRGKQTDRSDWSPEEDRCLMWNLYSGVPLEVRWDLSSCQYLIGELVD